MGLLNLDLDSRTKFILNLVFNAVLMVMISLIVYMTGGVNYSATHLMYIPILLAAYAFNIWITILMSIFAGILIGPLMPQDVALGLMQIPATWIFRTFMFSTMGIVSSLLSIRIRMFQKLEINRLYTNTLTNYPNFNKLKFDIDQLIESETPFQLIGFRIVNMNSIRQNISYDMGTKVLKKALDLALEFTNEGIYSVYSNEIAVLLPLMDYEKAVDIGKCFINKTANYIHVEDYKVGLLVNGAIIEYPKHISDSNDAIKKIAIILDQTTNDFDLHVYDYELERKSKLQGDLVPELLHALKNDEFYLEYQPKIDLSNAFDYNVEALIRWNHPLKGMISPGVFIPIAEETGIMNEITKVVFKKVIEQCNEWKSSGISVKTSINISHKDFNNKEFMNYFMETIRNEQIDPKLIELEITESGVIDNTNTLTGIFNELRDLGIKISIDDFGTGYNSLINLVKIPMDFLKIDKSFIDHLSIRKYELMVAQLIQFAHDMDIEVIAEGVETEEQLDKLKAMQCDFVQGFYLSRPLKPEAITAYYNNLNTKKSD